MKRLLTLVLAVLALAALACEPPTVDPAQGDGELFVVRVVVEGPGRVTSLPEGLDCGGPAACEHSFLRTDSVELTAIADDGAALLSIRGDCRAEAGALVAMVDDVPGDASCTITFAAVSFLRVLVEGDGSVDIDGVDTCGADAECLFPYAVGAQVQLEARPAPGWELLGYSGDCTSGDPFQTLQLDEDAECRVVFQPVFTGVVRYPIRVLIIGNGRIYSDPTGLDCDQVDVDCEIEFEEGTYFLLYAEAAPGWRFDAWGYQCDGLEDASPIGGDLGYAVACTATFTEIVPSTLTVAVAGDGAVTSAPAGIDCPAGACSAAYDPSTFVTLTATPGPGQTFIGWEGPCAVAATTCANTCFDSFDGYCDDGGLGADFSGCALGTDCNDCGPRGTAPAPGTATFFMDVDRACGAIFAPRPEHAVQVTVVGDGTVSGADGSIDCGVDCDAVALEGTTVMLSATPGPSSTFARWTGDCTGTTATTNLVVAEAATCTAVFVTRLDVAVRWSRRAAGDEIVGIRASSPAGRLAVLARDATAARVVVLDAATGREQSRVDVLVAPTAYASDAALARVVVADEDNLVRLYDTATGATISTMTGHTGAVLAVDVASDGVLVVSVDDLGRAKLWTAATGLVVRTVAEHATAVNDVAFAPAGDRFVTAGEDGTARLWSTTQAASLRTIDVGGAARSVAFSDDGTAIAVGRTDGGLRVHDVETGALLDQGTLPGAVRDVAFVSATQIAARVDPADLVVFDRTTDTATATRAVPGLLSADAADGVVVGATIAGVFSSVPALPAIDGFVSLAFVPGIASAAYEPDGARIAAGGALSPARIWTAATGALFDVVGSVGTALTWRVDLDEVLIGAADVVGLDAATGTETTRVPGVVTTAAIATLPDGALVATARVAFPYDVRLWELSVGDVYRTLLGSTGVVRALTASPDGAHVAAASMDGSVRVWSTTTGMIEKTLSGHTSGAVGVGLSADKLLSLGRDGKLRRWTFPAGTADGFVDLGCIGAALAWRGGDVAAVGCGDGTARLVDVVALEPRATFDAHAGAITAIDLAPDASGDVVTVSADEIAVWAVAAP